MDEDIQDDDYNDYDPDADDGLEEKIPGINADADDDFDADAEEIIGAGFMPPKQGAKQDIFHFTPASTILSPTTTNATSLPTPRDEMGQVIGFANTTDSPNLALPPQKDRSNMENDHSVAMLNGLGISSIQNPGLRDSVVSDVPLQHRSGDFDDDMYFDDGNFDDFGGDGRLKRLMRLSSMMNLPNSGHSHPECEESGSCATTPILGLARNIVAQCYLSCNWRYIGSISGRETGLFRRPRD